MSKKYFITKDNVPVKSNTVQLGWTEITKEEYDAKVKELNEQAEKKQTELDESIKAEQERNNLIWQRALENAEKELIEEGTIEAKENKKEEIK